MTLVVNIWNSADSEFLLFERGLGINANVEQLSLVFLVLRLWTSTLVQQRMKRSWKKIQLRQSLQQKKKNDTVFVLTLLRRGSLIEKGGTRGVMGRRKRWELPLSFSPSHYPPCTLIFPSSQSLRRFCLRGSIIFGTVLEKNDLWCVHIHQEIEPIH